MFDIKTDEQDVFIWYKALHVARDFSEEKWIDYAVVFHRCQMQYASSLYFICSKPKMEKNQTGPQFAFLNTELDEEIFVIKRKGFE